MATTSTALMPDADGWLNGRQACVILQCSLSALYRAAMHGYVKFRLVPGYTPQFGRMSVEQYALVRPKRVPRPARRKKAQTAPTSSPEKSAIRAQIPSPGGSGLV